MIGSCENTVRSVNSDGLAIVDGLQPYSQRPVAGKDLRDVTRQDLGRYGLAKKVQKEIELIDVQFGNLGQTHSRSARKSILRPENAQGFLVHCGSELLLFGAAIDDSSESSCARAAVSPHSR